MHVLFPDEQRTERTIGLRTPLAARPPIVDSTHSSSYHSPGGTSSQLSPRKIGHRPNVSHVSSCFSWTESQTVASRRRHLWSRNSHSRLRLLPVSDEPSVIFLWLVGMILKGRWQQEILESTVKQLQKLSVLWSAVISHHHHHHHHRLINHYFIIYSEVCSSKIGPLFDCFRKGVQSSITEVRNRHKMAAICWIFSLGPHFLGPLMGLGGYSFFLRHA